MFEENLKHEIIDCLEDIENWLDGKNELNDVDYLMIEKYKTLFETILDDIDREC